ncbi:DNA topology modulation protein [Paenibacillus koleovorans]|uniref:DNA topology modulation protein n=1 Tax=Paenibacillus koleovorans TaxID=121608 RepID=UPI0013E2936A|nr:DNA topology modulation protein [Paenibacillus koleovorans]
MKRVILVGCPGSGKSTLAKRLGEMTGLPVIHLDSLYWKPGWVASEPAEWRGTLAQLLERDEWLLDGNYTSTFEQRLKRADTVIMFDFPRWLCLYRVLKRVYLYRKQVRSDMAQGCPERLDWAFLKWVWSFRKRSRPLLLDKLENARSTHRVILFRKPQEVEAFLRDIES